MAVPVILCGAMKPVAAMVRANMLPEYDVVYAGHDLGATLREVPLIISKSNSPLSSLHTQLGSNDFANPPRALITGGGYNEAAFQELYQACSKACGGDEKLPVPFLRTSNQLTDQLAAEGKGPAHSSPDYPAAVVQRIKAKLRELGIAPGVEAEVSQIKGKDYFF